MDKIVWRVSELHVNKTPDNTAAFLMQKIMEMMGSLDRTPWPMPAGSSGPWLRLWWWLMAIF
jgi:hypothetical protein